MLSLTQTLFYHNSSFCANHFFLSCCSCSQSSPLLTACYENRHGKHTRHINIFYIPFRQPLAVSSFPLKLKWWWSSSSSHDRSVFVPSEVWVVLKLVGIYGTWTTVVKQCFRHQCSIYYGNVGVAPLHHESAQKHFRRNSRNIFFITFSPQLLLWAYFLDDMMRRCFLELVRKWSNYKYKKHIFMMIIFDSSYFYYAHIHVWLCAETNFVTSRNPFNPSFFLVLQFKNTEPTRHKKYKSKSFFRGLFCYPSSFSLNTVCGELCCANNNRREFYALFDVRTKIFKCNFVFMCAEHKSNFLPSHNFLGTRRIHQATCWSKHLTRPKLDSQTS